MALVTIRKGREKPIRNQHPWIFSGGIENIQDAQGGDIVRVVAHDGTFLAQGYFNPKSQIQVRLLSWQEDPINDAWWYTHLERAVLARPLMQEGIRLIHAESDYLPGLIVDRYADYLVIQALTLTIDMMKLQIAEWLVAIFKARGITIQGVYERSDVDARGREGLESVTGVLWGQAPPASIPFTVNEQHYMADVHHGHKTGFYLDQLSNHMVLRELVQSHDWADSAAILNTFAYTGSFSIASGLPSVNVDTSQSALLGARGLFIQNGLDDTQHQFIEQDCFDYLRNTARTNPKSFDIVVVDPPKFAQNKRQTERASKGYKDINIHALQCVKVGGWMLTFSCSGAVSMDLFQKIVFGALADSGRQAQIVRYLHASGDHPIALTFPEGEYLKGLLLRVY